MLLEKTKVDGETLFDGETFEIVAATQAHRVLLVHPDDGSTAGVLYPNQLSVMQLDDLISALPGFSLHLIAVDRDENVLADLTLEDIYG